MEGSGCVMQCCNLEYNSTPSLFENLLLLLRARLVFVCAAGSVIGENRLISCTVPTNGHN